MSEGGCGFGTGIDIAKLTVLMASFLVGLKTPGCPKFRLKSPNFIYKSSKIV